VYGVRSAPGAFSACLQLAGAVERAKERSGGKSFPVTKILNDSAPWTAPAGELSTDTGGFLKYSPSSSGSCVLWRASAAENFIRRVILFFPDGIEKAVLLHCGSGIVFEALPGGWRVLDGGNPVRSEKVGESFWTENQTVFEFLRSGSDIALRLNGAMIYEGAKGKDASGGRIKLASEKDKVIIISTVEDSINAR
jgi:hypothetical protein